LAEGWQKIAGSMTSRDGSGAGLSRSQLFGKCGLIAARLLDPPP